MKKTGDRTEQSALIRLGIQAGLLVLIGLIVSALILFGPGKDYTASIPLQELNTDPVRAQDQLRASAAQFDSVITLVGSEVVGDTLRVTLRPVSAGRATLDLGVPGNTFDGPYLFLRVTSHGLIIDRASYCYTHWKTDLALTALLLAAFSFMLFRSFRKVRRERLYSYLCVFFAGFGIWIAAIAVLLGISVMTSDSVTDVMEILKDSGYNFMLCSLPFCLVFSTGLAISNFSLIRHEGKNKVNTLGFILSAAILLGQVAAFLLYSSDFSGSDLQLRIHKSALCVLTSLYVLLECFLIGSCICGVLSVRCIPDCEADYVIILGCAIRKDGTLYPLLRGRVDRALAFVRAQRERTGKQAILVPSGGQGRNEVISEAEAMTRYLLEQGVPREQILPEDRSANTAQNMRFSRALIEERTPGAKVVFSTTNYHVFRSGIISRQAGFAPVGIGSETKWYYWPNAAVRELIGMLSYLRRSMLLLLLLLIILFAGLNLLLP